VIYGNLELTPVAIRAGALLSNRLFKGDTEKMDYVNVPTTVFTPLEYGCCGAPEEDIKKQLGEENVSTYHTEFQPLEWQYGKFERPEGDCYVKVIVEKSTDIVKSFHILAPNAGEIT
jgi:thioredoxin reductase (NADPH)